MRVLFIGGTGVISAACADAAVAAGHELHLLTRTESATRPAPTAATAHFADARDEEGVRRVLHGLEFDVVVDFVAFETSDIERDIRLFEGRTRQFVFIGTTSSYQKPALHLPITESTPLGNPYFEYSRKKIDCESLLLEAYRGTGFPVTIIRPSFTYDRTTFPLSDGWSLVQRFRDGRKVVVHGDGSALCTLTHADDFAKTFVGLLGDPRTIGDAFHITSDEILTWQQVYEAIAVAAGVSNPRFVHVASDAIAREDAEWGSFLLGDKAHSAFFDNSKVRSIVPSHGGFRPYWQGAREAVAWHDAHREVLTEDPARMRTMDSLIRRYGPSDIS